MTEKPKHFDITWESYNRKARCQANPEFPDGVVVDLTEVEGAPSCSIHLPYPASECGVHIVSCNRCGIRLGITAAGRADDPIGAVIPCKLETPKDVEHAKNGWAPEPGRGDMYGRFH